MSDPYAEATRHERWGGLSPVAKLFLVLGGCFAIGLTALVVVGLLVARKASEVVGDFHDHPVETLADMAEEFGGDVTVVSAREDAGHVVLRVGDGGEVVTVDLSGVTESLELAESLQHQILHGVRFEGQADESGGVVRITTSDGDATIELRGSEDGGFLHISSSGREMRFGAGDASAALPDWVPVYPDSRVRQRLFSRESDDATTGGVVLGTADSPRAVIDWYLEELESKGYSSSVVLTRDDGVHGRLEARSRAGENERKVSVLVGEDNDGEGFIVILHRTNH